MDNDKLLVRTYSVGFGDAIFVAIPDGDSRFYMLIDCGTKSLGEVLKLVVDNVRSLLPVGENGKRRLDLLVVTHPHADHIKGFNPKWFKDIAIKRIWLSAFMQPNHPQAKKTQAFQDQADAAAKTLLSRSGVQLAPGLRAMLMRSVWNKTALKALREDLPRASEIDAQYPLYLARDTSERLKPAENQEYQLSYAEGATCFRGFQDSGTCLRVLAPEWNIDGYYLGRGTFDGHSFLDQSIVEVEGYKATTESERLPEAATEVGTTTRKLSPNNVSQREFRQLQNRLLYSALAFSEKDGHIKNNVSIVLLLEWRGRRLLFTGDAEWQGKGVEQGRQNDSWDIMLEHPAVSQLLLQPVDLLKVAHHGSHNGTPFGEKDKLNVLDKLASPDRTQIIVSTEAGIFDDKMPVPYASLLQELGKRAANRRKYAGSPEEELRKTFQPQRTDQEPLIAGETVRYIDVVLDACDG